MANKRISAVTRAFQPARTATADVPDRGASDTSHTDTSHTVTIPATGVAADEPEAGAGALAGSAAQNHHVLARVS